MNQELADTQAVFRKGIETNWINLDQIADIHWIIKQGNFRKQKQKQNIYLCLIDYAKAFDCVDHDKLWKALRDGNTRPSYLSPEKPVFGSRSNI